jgi:tungstate transport system permease protein
MADFWTTVGSGDFARIVALSLGVSLSATALAILLGLPLGASLAVFRFPGRRSLIVIVNALLGLPPVVVGLALYLALSRAGPLGDLRMLFTPGAMVLAQTVLALPIVTALVHRAVADLWLDYGGALRIDGATPLRAIPTLLAMGRKHLLTAALAGFGRTISEVGAILVVGGNIAGYTRTMTTTIALETSKGNLSLALGLGLVLIGISMAVSATAFAGSERTVMMARDLAFCWPDGSAGGARRIDRSGLTTSVRDQALLASCRRSPPPPASTCGCWPGHRRRWPRRRGGADLVLWSRGRGPLHRQGHGTDPRQVAWSDRDRGPSAILRMSAGMTRGRAGDAAPAHRSFHAATRAAPTRWKSACGASSASGHPSPMAINGTATSAVAWERHSTLPPA